MNQGRWRDEQDQYNVAGRTGMNRRQLLKLTSGLGVAAVVGGGISSVPRRAAATPIADELFPSAEQETLTATLQQAIDLGIVPGAVVGIWVPGRGSFVGAAGIGDAATGTAIAIADAFRIASVTKTFTATVVLQLVDEGVIELDDVLSEYVSGLPNGDKATLRQVLGMTAGIPSYTDDPDFTAIYEADPLTPFRPDELLAIAARHPADFAPGTDFHYSDTNYVALGRLIEKVTGHAADEAIRQRILDPLELTSTSFPSTSEMPPPFAHGYRFSEGGEPLVDVTRTNPDMAWTAGAMISNLVDLRVWAKALADGALLKPATHAARLDWSPYPGSPVLPIRYGLGLMDVGGFLGHAGNIFGYSVFVGHLPEENATTIVLTNSGSTKEGNAIGLFAFLAQPLFPDRLPILGAPEGAPAP